MANVLIDADTWEAMKSATGPDFLAELIDVYLRDSPGLIGQMREGLAAGDVDGVRRAAHSLKSNSASLGANRLAGVARELEMIARGGTLAGAEAKLTAVEAEYAQLAPELVRLKDEC